MIDKILNVTDTFVTFVKYVAQNIDYDTIFSWRINVIRLLHAISYSADDAGADFADSTNIFLG